MKDMILFPEDIDRLNVILDQLTVKANLLLAVLVNKDGRLLTFQGSIDKIDTVSMAALIAGNSASTLAIANLMGETEFSAMYHQGKERHISITVVDENTFLCLVFDDRTNIDRVKVFARQFDRQIKKALLMVYDKTEDQVDLDLGLGFGESGGTSDAGQQNFYQAEQESLYQPQEPPAQPEQHRAQHIPQPQDQGINMGERVSEFEDAVNLSDLNAHVGKMGADPNDTNYLYLKNKIRETVKRKKET